MTAASTLTFADICLHKPIATARLHEALLTGCPVATAWCRRPGSTMGIAALSRGIIEELRVLLQVSVQESIVRRWLQQQPQPVARRKASFELFNEPIIECLENGRAAIRLAVSAEVTLRTLDPTHCVDIAPDGTVLNLPARTTWVAHGQLAIRDHAYARSSTPMEMQQARGIRPFHTPSAQKLALPFDTISIM